MPDRATERAAFREELIADWLEVTKVATRAEAEKHADAMLAAFDKRIADPRARALLAAYPIRSSSIDVDEDGNGTEQHRWSSAPLDATDDERPLTDSDLEVILGAMRPHSTRQDADWHWLNTRLMAAGFTEDALIAMVSELQQHRAGAVPASAVDTGTGRWEEAPPSSARGAQWRLSPEYSPEGDRSEGLLQPEGDRWLIEATVTPDDLRAAANIIERETGS